MEENSKVYRIRTKVGEDSPNVIHVPINQTYDTFEILSLKLNQTDTYKTYESGYGIIVGRVIANGGFGVPNSKVSVFIEVDDNESLKDTLLYNFTSTSDTDNDGVRYNLLPDYVESECHQDVGTFPNKRLVLDNDDVIEIFDKYWKYTTTTNNSGDYMLFGVPTGSQQLHVDIDLSDCGVLSQRPHNMIGKGYNIGMFESPNKFKSSTNLDSLPQIVTEDRGVYVYPYWGDTSNGDNTFAITRCDINIEYKFEPTAVFMGSIITDKGSNAIGKNCTATINNGKMSELVTGEGTIEMIRKTIDGRVEQFPIMGNRVIDGDGTWVYEIPMNLDYVTTDEFGNFVPTDNPDKGIATRARVRFRVRLDDTQYDNTARKRACYLIPNNPRLEDEGFDKTMEVDYEFGSLTREESYRDLFWNKVYTVKNYIPKIQKGDEQYNRQHTGIKWVNHANHNNPMPYNTLTVKLSFVHRIICILTGLVVQFVAFINQIISLLGFLFATLFDLPSVLFNGIAKLLEDRICLPWPLDDVCVGDLLALIFRGIGKGASSINILGKMATKLLTPTCIVLDSGFCDDNVNKVDFYPGCGYFLFNLFPLSSATDVVERGDIAWEKTQEAQQEKYNGKSSDEVRTASNHTGKLHNCYENALAQENEATSFNFNNDWINGTLYAPLWYRKITPKKRFLFGLFTRKAKDEWCTSKQYFASLRYIQHCAVERDGSKTITNFDGDTTDLKFIRNSECDNGDCHERHVALPGLGGVIHSKKTMLGQDVYYYKPVEWSANLPSNELYTGKKKGELKLLFATDIVLLGSLDSCDMNGVPQFFKNLESTTYNMPGDILFTDYEFHYVIDPETGNATSNYNTQDYTVHSEMAGCDWGNPNEFNKKDGGLFYSIGCTNGDTELKAKSCVNLSRICEYGVSLDVTKQIPIINNENIGNWKDASESEIEQAEDGTYYKRLITDGFISWDELYNLDERSMFATMNGNQLKTKINTNNGLKEYDFRYLYPENFDGSLAERMKRQTQNYPPEINYKFNYLLEKASRDYYLFRMGNKPYYYDSNNAFPRYENSFYFYFGLNEGKTAIEKFNSKYFAECDNEKGVYNNFNIYKKSSSWCSSLNETYDGFIALDLEKIATPYSIVITGDNTFTLDGITDEKIIFYNKSYSAPEGFEDYADNKFEEFKDEKTFIPNGAYYLTITDANEEEYHYELDMGYNFLTYSNNVQSFKKNHEDLLRSLGTNNAIMNDNTKLVYSNPEKIEREIGGVITVYGVHDNDGDIEQYKIEVREKVDFDITDIQKTIKNVGDTWYDANGNFYEVTSIDTDGTIHYTKNGEGDNTDKKKGDTVEEYEGMKKELVVPEWYDKNAVKHNLTEKDKDGNYVYEEGAQQADFNPLVKKDMEGGDTWYDANGNKYTASSLHDGKTVVDYSDWTLELNLPIYYDKNGEKQYYPYQPNKETSVVDFELTDRLKEVTSIKQQGEEILTVEQWSGLTTDEKVLYEEVYVKEDGEERIIITKEEWESIEDTVKKGKYAKMYRNKYVIIHYTKNGEGDYRGRDTWYDADGVKHTASNSDIGRTLVDYTDWKMELLTTLPTWYDLDGNLYKVTKNDKDGIHYTKNGEGDYTISGRNTVTEVIFNSSLENPPYPYLEFLYNLNKGDEYVEKYDLKDSDGVEYGTSYKVISPYALTISEYDKLTLLGKFDYEQKYETKQEPTVFISPDAYNKLPDGYSQKSYDVYQYVNETDKENIISKEQWENLESDAEREKYEPYTYVNKYDVTIITSDDWGKLPTEYCKEDYAEAYVNKNVESDIIKPEAYNGLSDGYGKNDYKEETTYCKKENKKEYITEDEYENDESIQSLYQPSHVLKEDKEGKIKILIENGYDKTLNKEDYENIIVNYNAFGTLLDSTNKTEIEFYTKKGEAKKCNYDSTDKRWKYGEINIGGNYIINYQILMLEKNKDEIYYDYEGKQQTVKEETETVLDFTPLVRVLSFDTWLDEDGALCEVTSITPQGEKILTFEQWDTLSNDEKTLYEEVYVNRDDETVITKEQWEALASDVRANYTKMYRNKVIIHYTKNGERDYTISGRNTVINYNQPIWTKITRSDDNYSWVDKNGVTQYAGAETLVVDYSWLLKAIIQEEIMWYDKEGNIYKVTSVDKDDTIHYSINGKGDYNDKKLGDIVVDFNHDSFILILDDIDDTWYDEDGKLCEVTSITPQGEKILTFEQWDTLSNDEKTLYEEVYVNRDDETVITKEQWEALASDVRANYTKMYRNKVIIHYTKNGERDYTISGRNTVVNYYKFMTEPLYIPTWYDVDGNLYKVTSIAPQGEKILTDEQWGALTKDEQTLYDEVYVNKQDSSVKTVDEYKQLPNGYSQKSYDVYNYVHKTNEEDIITKAEWEGLSEKEREKYEPYRYVNKYNENNIITSDDWGKLPTEYCKEDYAKMYRNKVIIIYYTKNGEEKYKEDKEYKPYIIVGRNTVVDWSKYIGYEGAEITYDNGVITDIKNVLWYDSEKQSFAFGVPDENRTYVITVTQMCDGKDTKNEIKTNVFVSGVIKYKMFINGIDYEIIKNFDGHTGWSYNGTITKNKLTTNVGDLNENNPWFNVDKIYYHDYFEGKGNNKDEYPKINLKDIDRFGIDKDENQQTYRIYATEIDKEDEEVGKKVNETYHGEDGKNKTVKAKDVIATFVNKRNEDDVTTYKVIDFTVKKLTVVGDTWYDTDGNLYKVTNVVIQGKEILTFEQLSALTKDEKTLYDEVYINKQDSSIIIDAEVYNQLEGGYSQKSYDVYKYVHKTNEEDIITKAQWESLSEEQCANYKPYTYVNKYDATKFITPDDWGKLTPDYCKGDYAEAYVNKTNETDVITKEEWEKIKDTVEKGKYAKMYRNKYAIVHYTKNSEGDYRGRVTWYDKEGKVYIVTTIMPPNEEVITAEKWSAFTPTEKEWYEEVYVNKQDSSVIITTEAYNQLDGDYSQKSYKEVYVNRDNETVFTKEQWESIEDTDEKNKYVKMYVNKYDEEDIITPEDWAKLPTEYCKGDYEIYQYVNKYDIIHYIKNGESGYTIVGYVWYDEDGNFCEVTSVDTDGTIHYTKNIEGNYTIVGRNTVVDYSDWVITLNIIISVDTYNKLPDYSKNSYEEVYVKKDGTEILTKDDWKALASEDERAKYDNMYRNKDVKTDIKNYFKQYVNKDVSDDFISVETYNQLPKNSEDSQNGYNEVYVNKQDSSVKTIDEYNQLKGGYSQKSYDIYQYVNKTDERDIIMKDVWEGLSEEERAKYEPYQYVNKYDATKFITSDDWSKLPPEYCKEDYAKMYRSDAKKIITPEDWGKLPKYCQEDYTEVYLSTWYDKNGTLNYMLPSEEGQKRIDFRPLVKTIEKEGETWYDANSVKRAAGSDDISQEVLDYSKKTKITQFKEITFKTDDKTWYDKNGIENKADSDKLGLYIDITYMTKGNDTTLFNIYNKEYIDKLVIDKVEVYCQDSYDEVYVNSDDETVITKEQWETLKSDEERAKYDKMYSNRHNENDIITPEEWDKLPKYSNNGYTCQYNFNKKGLHSVRIYLTLQEQETETPYKGLLSDVIGFDGCSDLNTIVLPNIGITTIGKSAFNGCKSLTSIDLPDSITTIDDNAFNGCEKLSSVYIPYNVETIGANAFNGCKSLTNIVLPKNITTIDDYAFANCEKLQSVRTEMKDVANTTVASNAFDNTNIGLIIYVPMDKDGKIYDLSGYYNKAGWGNVKDKVVAIELTVFNYNKVNINPSDLLDEFARNTSGNTNGNTVYYNFIDSYVASEYKAFTQVTYFKASDFVNAINNVLSRRREIADRMFNTFYMTQEGESKSFNITSNTDETPVQPIIVYHEEEIDDVDIDYTLTTPNLTYEQINMLKNVNIPTITYKSSPFFSDGTSSDDIIITKSNNIEKKPLSTGIMNVKQKSIPLDSGNKDFPSISLSGGVKAINPSKTNIADLFEFPVIDKIESSSVSAWTKFSNIPSPNPDNIGMINMDGYVYGRHNNGVVERDGNFEIRKLGKYEINLSENLNGNVENSTKPYTYAERRVITGLTNYSIAQWCIVKLRSIVQADDVTEETLKNIWKMLFNPTNEEDEPTYDKEKLLEVIDTMTVVKQTIDEDLIIYIQCDETIDVVEHQWKIDQGEEDYITEKLIQFKKFNVVANKDYERQYAFTDAKKANLNIGEINENFNFDNELKLSTEVQSIDVSGQSVLAPENLTRLSFNQGEKEGGHYQLFGLSRYRDGFFGKEDMNQYPLYNAAKNGIVYQIDNVEKETMLSHEGEITKINDKEKQIQGTFNEPYHSSYFYSMYKFKGSNDDERVWRDAESTNGLYNAKRGFNCCDLATGIGFSWEDRRFENIGNVPDAYFLDTNYIRHVYCVYVKGNMKMLSPLYEFAPTQLVGTWGHLESYDERDKSVIGIKVNDFARVYFEHYDYTLGGPFKIKRKYKHRDYGTFSYTIPEGTIKYKDEKYYYMIVDDKLKDENKKYTYEFEYNMGRKNMYNYFHKDHVIAKDITDLRHLTWTNGNKLDENNFILIEWIVPESDSFRFISEQKNTETEDFDEKITVEKVYMQGHMLTRLPKNNGQYKDDDEWTIQYKEKTEEGKEVDVTKQYKTSDLLNGGIKFDKPYIITKNIIK